MLKTLAVTLAAVLAAGPAAAFSRLDADRLVLLRTAKGTGVTFLADTQMCEEEPRLMGAFVPAKGQVHLCFDNMEPYGADPDLTVKHELIHVAQFCKGGLINSNVNYLEDAQVPLDYYPKEQLMTEAEARALAPRLPLLEVARLLVTYCR